MIIAVLLAAAAPASTAVDAERAFAARAKRVGQWAAFREYAEPTAVMFNPQAVWAHEFLKGRKNPPRSVQWWPARSFVSCDGDQAVNTGPWRNAGKHGYFTTVWVRQKDGGWKWSVDGGDELKAPISVPRQPAVRRASCANLKAVAKAYRAETKTTAQIAGSPPSDAGQGRSADGTLTWEWRVAKNGARRFQAQLWNGRRYVTVLEQRVAAPKP
ncbi:hypothetical protein ACFQPG_03265 [Sphingomonas sp. GCM10030256]|uniref:hypothetical protein n=1 Tax=Sphingomonas sp. GCM10030256 TaxID=3273427 RepID=UPI0036192131